MNWKLFIAGFVAVVTVTSFMHYNAFFLERSSSFDYMVQQAANVVGVTIGVGENQYNTIAQQLREKEEELESREVSLLELEQEVKEQISQNRRFERRAYLYISIVGSIVLSLLALNFYLDLKWRRRKGVDGESSLN